MAISIISKQPPYRSSTLEGFILIELMISLVLILFFVTIVLHYQTLISFAKKEALTRYALINILRAPSSNDTINCDPYTITRNPQNLPSRMSTMDYFCKKMDDEQYYQVKGSWVDYKKNCHSITLVAGIP